MHKVKVKDNVNGDMRACVDLPEVNKAIIPDKIPLPNIGEIMTEFQNAKVFSRLYPKQAYHQLKLHSHSRSRTGSTHDGVLTYKRLCFGLAQAFSREGFPDEIVSYNGRQFVSQDFDEFFKFRGSKDHKS